MGTWVKETDTAIYLMEEEFYIERILKSDANTKGERKLILTEMKRWLNRADAPGTMVVAVGVAGAEPLAKPKSFDVRNMRGDDEAEKPSITFIPAHPNNFRPRRAGFKVEHIVIHNTVGTTESAINTFQSRSSQVSAHYIIDRDGEIIQMVDDRDCAFHAGNRDMNDRSIGIEHEATKDVRGLTPEQEKASASLIKYLMSIHNIPTKNVTAHRCIVATECPSLIFPLLGPEKLDALGSRLETWIKNNL